MRSPRAPTRKTRAPHGAPSKTRCERAPLGRGRGLGGGRGRRGGAVVELLLGAEQRIEHLLAQALAQCERKTGADRNDQQPATHAALAPPRALPERRSDLTQGDGRIAQVTLELLVLEQGLGG